MVSCARRQRSCAPPNQSSGSEHRDDGHPASSAEAAHRPETAGSMHGPGAATGHTPFGKGPGAATGHTPFGKALRCFSVGPCHACRRGRFRSFKNMSLNAKSYPVRRTGAPGSTGALSGRLPSRRLGKRCGGTPSMAATSRVVAVAICGGLKNGTISSRRCCCVAAFPSD
jgi:hypothetical protein